MKLYELKKQITDIEFDARQAGATMDEIDNAEINADKIGMESFNVNLEFYDYLDDSKNPVFLVATVITK
jgi:hypothetical protein